MHKLEGNIDICREIEAMVRFVRARWETTPDLYALFEAIRTLASRDARFWVDSFPIFFALRRREEARTALLEDSVTDEDEKNLLPFYDHSCTLLGKMVLAVDRVTNIGRHLDGPWDFEARATAAYETVLQQFPDLEKSLPQGWAELRKAGAELDDDTYAETQQQDEAEFEGASAMDIGISFPGTVARAAVRYSNARYNRSPAKILVWAAYGQFLAIQRHLNTMAVLAELDTLDFREHEPVPVFDLTGETRHPFVAAIFELIKHGYPDGKVVYSREEYLKDLSEAQRFRALSPDEQKAAREASRAGTREYSKDVRKGSQVRKQQEPKDERACRRFLLGLVQDVA
jgi:hypothetical protein